MPKASTAAGARRAGSAALTLAVMAGATEAQVDVCQAVRFEASPVQSPGGMAFDGQHLWIGSMSTSVRDLACVDPDTLQVVRTIPAPGTSIGGLTWDGASLWCVAEEAAEAYRVDPTDGTVLHVVPRPSFGSANPAGADLAWDGSALWHVDYAADTLYQLDPTDGRVLAAYPTPAPLPTGLAMTAEGLVVSDASWRRLDLIDPATGVVLRTCAGLPEIFPYGLAQSATGTLMYGGVTTHRVREHDMGLTVVAPEPEEPPEAEEPADPWVNYCSSVENSTGGAAMLSARGSASLEDRDLTLVAGPVPRGFGVFLYGMAQADRSFGRGRLCVERPRLASRCVSRARGGELAQRVRWKRLMRHSNLEPGATVFFQALYLDRCSWPRFNTSDGLAVTLAP